MNFIGIAKHINRHLKFVTAIFAGPDMTDVVFAHVLGSLRCNHFFTALVARGAKMPTVASRFGDHYILPFFLFFKQGDIKAK
jgi:hypothetical protein